LVNPWHHRVRMCASWVAATAIAITVAGGLCSALASRRARQWLRALPAVTWGSLRVAAAWARRRIAAAGRAAGRTLRAGWRRVLAGVDRLARWLRIRKGAPKATGPVSLRAVSRTMTSTWATLAPSLERRVEKLEARRGEAEEDAGTAVRMLLGGFALILVGQLILLAQTFGC
jgi:hypothetical protein